MLGDDGRQITTAAFAEASESRVEIRAARASTRYFPPLEARAIATPRGRAFATRTGAVVAATGDAAEVVWFERGARDQAPVAAPDAVDLDLPDGMRTPLSAIASEWTADAGSRMQKLKAIEARLKLGYTYSLRHSTPAGAEPILDFLPHNRSGHCEFFASAMTLLSRSLGIPARVVGGYHVTEYNSFGQYYVVRDRNAHAWLQAWLPTQGWVSFDPTPAAGSAAAAGGTFTSLLDLLWSGWLLGWTPEGRARHLGAVAGVLMLVVRSAVRRLRAGFVRPRPAHVVPASFARLRQHLESLGETRSPAEPLEVWAARLGRSARLTRRRAAMAARIVEMYALLRYGGIGSERQIDQAVAEFFEPAPKRNSVPALASR